MIRRSPRKLSGVEESVRSISQIQMDPFLQNKKIRSNLVDIRRAQTKKPKLKPVKRQDDPAVTEQLQTIRAQLIH